MFVVFDPGKVLVGAVVWAMVGAACIYGAVYHSPDLHPLWPMLILGVAMAGFAVLSVVTVALYVLRGLWLFFTGWWR